VRALQRLRITPPSPATHMLLSQSAETMLTHVLLPARAAMLAAERVVRESSRAGRARPTQPGTAPFDQVPIVRSSDDTAEPSAGDEQFAATGVKMPESHVWREFPVLGWLHAAAPGHLPGRQAEASGESAPAAMQVLRRFSAAQLQRARMGLAALPSLGQGEALPAGVRQLLETIL